MKILLATAMLASLTMPAFGQSSPSPGPQTQNGGAASPQAAAQKIKQDLQKAGFSNVKIVAESFVVQGKSPDGDPVVMTIGPHGMSVFEAMNEGGSGSGTVGANRSPAGSTGSESNPSANSNSTTRK